MKEAKLFYWASQGPSPPQVASMLKEKAAFLQKHDHALFGKDFRDYLTESLKAKKQSIEALAVVSKSTNKKRGHLILSRKPKGWVCVCVGGGGVVVGGGGGGAKIQVELKR